MAEETKDTEVKGNEEFGTAPVPEGFANPPIDDLMKHADSKYALAIFAAKRARQMLEETLGEDDLSEGN